MNFEKISIIIVTYNNANYIEKCVESALNQTYQNIEVIVVDDGSTDETESILKKYQNKIKIYKKVNEGVASARNLGIKVCNTKYFMFLDSDDYLELNAIEIMYKKMIETNSDIVIGNIEETKSKDIIIEDDKYEYIFNGKIKYFMVSWNKLMKREIFNDLVYPNIHIAEDDYMIYHILKKIRKITFISSKTYNYYINPNGLTSKKLDYYKEVIYVFKDRYLFFENTVYKNIFYKMYINYYIYAFCLFKDKNITNKDLIKEYRKEVKPNNIKYVIFYMFPNLYYKLFNIRRKICKTKYQ